jgi:hypothetical protein
MEFNFKKISCFLFFGVSFFVSAQNVTGKKVEKKFFRPALTTLFVNGATQESKIIIESLKKTPPEMRFDNHEIENKFISVNLESAPQFVIPENVLEIKKAKKDFTEKLAKFNSEKSQAIINSMNLQSRQIVGKWYSRDVNGNMSSALIKQRGQYSATDADVIKDKSSEISRLSSGIGKVLMKKSYVALYEVSNIKTMDEVYNEIDAAAQKTAALLNKPFTPTKRTKEGYKIEYSCRIFKLNWSDSMKVVFENNYLLTESDSENRNQKINAFNNATFPLVFVNEVLGTIFSTQSNDPASYTFSKRKSMQELLEESAPDIQEDAMFNATKLIDDFKTKAGISLKDDNYPPLAKLGTKEGLYLDEQFYVYEIQDENADGIEEKKKKAVVRVRKIANNTMIAKGESPLSTFRQVGGRRIYDGMLVEMKEDLGFSATLGTGTESVYIGADVRVDRYLKVYNDSSALRFLRGIHLTGFATLSGVNDTLITDQNKSYMLEGSKIMFGAGLGKELFITRKGRLYLYPELGGSLVAYANTKFDGTDLEENDKDKTWASVCLNSSLGIGLNLSSRLSLLFKPSYLLRLTNFADSEGTEVDTSNFSKKFQKMNDSEFQFYVGLRLRF